uniref:50S ribosomal protein L31 n=1 Tax=uncultured Parolsenella sp. TaxID=2083008 RepID=UPI0027D99C5C
MKKGIHPQYGLCTVRCTCGNTWVTRSTVSEMTVDLCDKCHPFYTGQQKLVDTGGRVQRFSNKFGGAAAAQLEKAAAAKAEREKKAAEAAAAKKAERE